jgi:CarD family transcriptional regulator
MGVGHFRNCDSATGVRPLTEKLKIGEKVICPAHFPGVIEGIEEKVISGQQLRFYIVRILQSDARIMIPIDNSGPDQPRRPISRREVEQIYERLASPDFRPTVEDTETRNQRYQRYKSVLTGGSLLEIAGLLKALHQRKGTTGLALGETRILETAMDLLVGEVMSAGQTKAETVRKEIELRLEAT